MKHDVIERLEALLRDAGFTNLRIDIAGPRRAGEASS